jgi:hypothetical protein
VAAGTEFGEREAMSIRNSQSGEVLFPIPLLDSIAPAQIQKALLDCERLLMRAENRINIELTRQWARRFPSDAGVYAVFAKGELIYVGETGKISARMADFLSSCNHVLRRSIGNRLFANEVGFQKATAYKGFPDHIEALVAAYIRDHLVVAPVVVVLGRSEIEEHMTEKYRPPYNNKGKRGSKLHGLNGRPEIGS